MTEEQWNTGWMRSLAVMFNGTTLDDVDEMGEPLKDDSFLILLNSYGDKVTYTLPPSPQGRGWKLLMNTDDLEHPFAEQRMDGALDVAGRSVVLLRELVPAEVGHQPSEQEAVPDETPELAETPSTVDRQESTVDLAIPILAD